jgi:hypothetical protein
MKRILSIICLAVLLMLIPATAVSCLGAQNSQPAFYDAGSSDFSPTGTQFFNTVLFRFDTSAASRTLTVPNAADIVSAISSPSAGSVLLLAVCADGENQVNLVGGSGVTIKPAATTVAGNTTATFYCELDNTGKGTQHVVIY